MLTPQYNILKIAGSTLGFKHTEETLVKMSLGFLKKSLDPSATPRSLPP